MKKIKVIGLFLCFFITGTIVRAQSGVTIEASQLFTSFKYSDSQGNELNSEYSGIFTGAYSLGYHHIAENGIMMIAEAGMRRGGATMVYDNMNYTWNLQYADLKLGAGYILKKDRISPFLNVSGYFAHMLRGFQTINNEDFDLRNPESIKSSDFGIFITPGVQVTITETMSLFTEFNYMLGLQNLEKDESQKSSNSALGLTLGLSLSLRK